MYTMKRALLIGINYTGTDSELQGCCNDISDIFVFLTKKGFEKKNIIFLTDVKNPNYDSKLPTCENIIKYIKKIVSLCKPGDTLYVHYSGHGSYVSDRNGDEKDKRDECICPLDYENAGMIIDDTLNTLLVKSLQPGVKLRAVFDSCHSGSCLDLPIRMDTNKYERENNDVTNKDVIFMSGCRDIQTSADSSFDERSNGALTWSFLTTLDKNKTISWKNLCIEMRKLLTDNGYDQVPQLDADRVEQFTKLFDL
jgi:metacaspase-1